MMSSLTTTWCYISLLLAVAVYLVLGASNTSCPTGFYYSNTTSKCDCDEFFVKQGLLICNQREGRAFLRKVACVSSAEDNNSYYVGVCPITMEKQSINRVVSLLPSDPALLTDAMCGPYNRKGLLCSRCIDGYGLPIYSTSLKCVNCISTAFNIFKYICIQFIPLTCFFIIIVISRMNITAGPLLGYFLFCLFYYGVTVGRYRLISDYINVHSSEPIKVLFHISQALSELWTLLFFKSLIPPFCISEKLNSIHIQMFSVVPAVYIAFLVITVCSVIELHARNYRFIHFLFKPCLPILSKFGASGSNSIIHAYVTFILMSSTTTINNAAVITVQTSVYSSIPPHNQTTFLYIDTNVHWPPDDKTLFVLLAVVSSIFLVLIPALLLCVYPTRIYRQMSQLISTRKQLAITTFAEALHNCFKDGLNGTRDYRALAGLVIIGSPFLGLFGYIVSYDANNTGYTKLYLSGYILFALSFVVSYMRPCKSTLANFSLSYHGFMIAVVIEFVIHPWSDLTIDTEMIELTFVIVPLFSHVLVLIWAVFVLCVWLRAQNCTPTIVLQHGTSCFGRLLSYCRSHGGYYRLN